MNTAALQAFVMVMQTGSVSVAAERLHLSQPAVSKRLRTLEHAFGVVLFDHIGRSIQPTAAAQQLLFPAQRWLDDYQQMRRQMSLTQQEVAGALTIGTSHHIGLHHLPTHLKSFVKHYPKIELAVRFVDSEQAHDAVLSGELELAFLTLPPERHPKLAYQELWQEELCFVVAPFHPLAQQPMLTLADLLPYQGILPASQTYTSQITLAAFWQQQLKPKTIMSTNPLESIRMLVSIGLGWSTLPHSLLNHELQPLTIADLPPLQRKLGMVWHPDRTRTPATTRLAEWVNDSP